MLVEVHNRTVRKFCVAVCKVLRGSTRSVISRLNWPLKVNGSTVYLCDPCENLSTVHIHGTRNQEKRQWIKRLDQGDSQRFVELHCIMISYPAVTDLHGHGPLMHKIRAVLCCTADDSWQGWNCASIISQCEAKHWCHMRNNFVKSNNLLLAHTKVL